MKRKLFILIVVVVMVISFVLGSMITRHNEEKKRQVENDWNSVLTITANGLVQECTVEAFSGNTDYDVENYDFSFLIEMMDQYVNDGYTFSNLGILMNAAGEKVNGADDLTCYEEFKQLSASDQNKVLSKMFTKVGYTNIKIPKYDYVPTGELTEDGKNITTYENVGSQEIKMREYSMVLPLKIFVR